LYDLIADLNEEKKKMRSLQAALTQSPLSGSTSRLQHYWIGYITGKK